MESTDEGKLLEVDLKEKKIIWSFMNKANTEDRGYMNWSRKINQLPFDLATLILKNVLKEIKIMKFVEFLILLKNLSFNILSFF